MPHRMMCVDTVDLSLPRPNDSPLSSSCWDHVHCYLKAPDKWYWRLVTFNSIYQPLPQTRPLLPTNSLIPFPWPLTPTLSHVQPCLSPLPSNDVLPPSFPLTSHVVC